MLQKSLLAGLALFVLLGISGCGPGTVDYSEAAAQTGGPEQGVWQDRAGVRLELTSGKFTYKKATAAPVSGTYQSSEGAITLKGDGGETLTAQFPDPNGPLTVDGTTLTKTD